MKKLFGLEGYRNLLQKARMQGYRFGTFDEDTAATGTVYLRHDIDLSLEHALWLARVEAQMEIAATYFVMVRSMFYNLFSAESMHMLTELLSLGHRVGLHGSNLHATGSPDFAVNLTEEFALLETISTEVSPVFSLHNPGSLTIPDTPAPYIYVHGEKFRAIKYISDSRMHFREGPPLVLFEKTERSSLQLLIHPIFWTESGADLASVLESFQQNCQQRLHDNLLQDFDGSFVS